MSGLKRRITEALPQDDRITGLGGWGFEPGRKGVRVSLVIRAICCIGAFSVPGRGDIPEAEITMGTGKGAAVSRFPELTA